MYFSQSDLLRGLSRQFLKDFMAIAHKEKYAQGDFLFREGDSAKYFYLLLKGRVKLAISDIGSTVYIVDHPGEAFGWSSLVSRESYSASAECKDATTLLRIEVRELQTVLEKHQSDGLVFFKRLAARLGNRLLQSYKMISSTSEVQISTSTGTGQVLESDATRL
jgi:CRP-like cAMP-binding protein